MRAQGLTSLEKASTAQGHAAAFHCSQEDGVRLMSDLQDKRMRGNGLKLEVFRVKSGRNMSAMKAVKTLSFFPERVHRLCLRM